MPSMQVSIARAVAAQLTCAMAPASRGCHPPAAGEEVTVPALLEGSKTLAPSDALEAFEAFESPCPGAPRRRGEGSSALLGFAASHRQE